MTRARSRAVTIGDVTAEPGDHERFGHETAETCSSDPVRIRVTVENGGREGPTAFLAAAVHGDGGDERSDVQRPLRGARSRGARERTIGGLSRADESELASPLVIHFWDLRSNDDSGGRRTAVRVGGRGGVSSLQAFHTAPARDLSPLRDGVTLRGPARPETASVSERGSGPACRPSRTNLRISHWTRRTRARPRRRTRP